MDGFSLIDLDSFEHKDGVENDLIHPNQPLRKPHGNADASTMPRVPSQPGIRMPVEVGEPFLGGRVFDGESLPRQVVDLQQ